jgi:hypothetical protein
METALELETASVAGITSAGVGGAEGCAAGLGIADKSAALTTPLRFSASTSA